MPKGSEELTKARKEEIISACEQLYKTMNFKDITIKEIANAASFTYGYYNSGAQLLKFGPDDGYGSGYITYVGT